MSLAPLKPDAELAALAARDQADREHAERVRLAAVEHAKTAKVTPGHPRDWIPEAEFLAWPKISAAEMAAWRARQNARMTPGERAAKQEQADRTADWHRRFTASCDREDAMKAQAAAREAEIAETYAFFGWTPAESEPGFYDNAQTVRDGE